jgi:hypothetical protein
MISMAQMTDREKQLRAMREARLKRVVVTPRPAVAPGGVVAVIDDEIAEGGSSTVEKINVAVRDVLLKGLPVELLERLEGRRRELGLRSRSETIRVLLERGLK